MSTSSTDALLTTDEALAEISARQDVEDHLWNLVRGGWIGIVTAKRLADRWDKEGIHPLESMVEWKLWPESPSEMLYRARCGWIGTAKVIAEEHDAQRHTRIIEADLYGTGPVFDTGA